MKLSKVLTRMSATAVATAICGIVLFFVGLRWGPPVERLSVITTCFSFTLLTYSFIAQYLHNLKYDIREVKDQFEFERTGSCDKNWEYAIDMAKKLDAGWQAYDTTSGINREDFEQAVEAALKKGCTYYRIVCGNAVRDYSDVASGEDAWRGLINILNPGNGNDPDGDREQLRKAIKAGKFKLLHLSRPLEMDLFVIQDGATPTESLVGFSREQCAINEDPYTSGIYSKNKNVSADLQSHFYHLLWHRALKHARDEYNKMNNGQSHCLCAEFFNPTQNCLVPREDS